MNWRCTYLCPSSLACIDNNRIRHRDWYIDEGAVSPISGVIASISDTVIKTWASTSTYFKVLSATMHKEPSPQKGRSLSVESLPTEPYRGILTGESLAFPVQAALTYPPHHLERVAYVMASEKLPDTKHMSRHRRTHPWSASMQMTYVSEPVPRKKKPRDHGKAHQVTTETGQFAYSVMRTGLHGTCICGHDSIVEKC
jgi:hypothetical protein